MLLVLSCLFVCVLVTTQGQMIGFLLNTLLMNSLLKFVKNNFYSNLTKINPLLLNPKMGFARVFSVYRKELSE
jgi:hypothetical protein